MIEFVTVENVNQFLGNPLAAQHRLRYRSIIERQKWDVPNYCQMEFDQYDNPAAKYLVYRDEKYIARGVSRFYPTTLPYMLEQLFSHFVTDRDIPKQSPCLGRFTLLHRPDAAASGQKADRRGDCCRLSGGRPAIRHRGHCRPDVPGILAQPFYKRRLGDQISWVKQLFSTTGTKPEPPGCLFLKAFLPGSARPPAFMKRL